MADYTYDATVKGIHDGDTINVDIDLGLDVGLANQKLRWYGINAPELNTPEGKKALAFLGQFLKVGDKIMVDTMKDKTEKYGRYLAIIRKKVTLPAGVQSPPVLADGTINLNDLMVLNGQAKAYFGGAR